MRRPVRFRQVWRGLLVVTALGTAAPRSAVATGPDDVDDLLARRRYLVAAVTAPDYGLEKMPALLGEQFQGEWAVGTLSMTACALVQLALDHPETREESATVADGLVTRLLQADLRRFDAQRWGEDPLETLDGPRGHIGYLAHLGIALAAFRYLGGDGRHDALHRRVAEALVRRIGRSPAPLLETYPGERYTADNAALYAALALFARFHGDDFGPLFERFVAHAEAHLLDRQTGTIAFRFDRRGRALGRSRGSGVGWNSFFLPFFAPELAQRQYERTKAHFLVRLPFGLAALREYPRGHEGAGDVDSGPLLAGLSPSATGFFLAGARRAGDAETYATLFRTASLVGVSTDAAEGRAYRLAPLVGDAIVLAMRTARPWTCRYCQR